MTDPAPGERTPLLVQYLLAGRLRERRVSRLDVIALWQKATARLRDAALTEISIEGSLEAAYQAVHSACLAVLATRGLRTTSGHGHHEMAFAGVAPLGIPGLGQLIPNSEEIRTLRSGSMYDPVLASEDDRKRAVAWARTVLPRMRAVLVEWDRSLDSELADLPP
jgi:hypothetical protein